MRAERMHWMDLLRGTAVVLIAVMHATVDSGSGLMAVMNVVLEPFRVPMLLVISGTLLHRSLAKPLGVYVSGKARRILWPWLVWMLPMVALWWPVFAGNPPAFLVDYTHLWYLTVLLFCYGLALVTHRVAVPDWATALVLSSGAWAAQDSAIVSRYLWFSAFFFAGAALAGYLRSWITAGPLLVVVLAAVAVTYGVVHAQAGGLGVGPLQLAASLCGVAAAIWVVARAPGEWRIVRSLGWVGRRSIVTYVAHMPVVVILAQYAALSWVVVLPVTLLVCLALTWAEPRTRWLYEAPTRARAQSLSRLSHR